MKVMNWYESRDINLWTGETRTRHLRKFTTSDDAARVYTEVYELAGRIYWSANIHIPNRPDISRIAYGTYAAIPGAMAVAKGRASRIAGDAMRAANRFARAA